MHRRRFLLTSVAGALIQPRAGRAQQAGRTYRIAFLGSTSASDYASQVAAFPGGLRDFGYLEGRNLVIDFRWALGSYERLPELAAELVRSKPDVLVTHGPPGALAAKRATDTNSDGGIVRPRAFAVFRLITSSNLLGRSTGSSAGVAVVGELLLEDFTRGRVENSDLLLSRVQITSDECHESGLLFGGRVTVPQPNPINSGRPFS